MIAELDRARAVEGAVEGIAKLFNLSRQGKPQLELGQQVARLKEDQMEIARGLQLPEGSLRSVEREIDSSLSFVKEDIAWDNDTNIEHHGERLGGLVFEAASSR